MDPYVETGLGEEDFTTITLSPYIQSAREGVERMGQLLEKYGTYESNGMAFSDKDEIWWLENTRWTSMGSYSYPRRRLCYCS